MGGRSEDSLSSALERICFLEWRLEQMEAVIADERRTVRELRERVAEGAQREAEAARRVADLEERLAEARREVIALADRTAHADAERSLLERRMQSNGRDTSREMAELCRKLEREKERAEQKSRALEHARERLNELERSRESFFLRLIEWQKMARADDVDLAEFIAELRGEIARLAADNEAAQAREESLLDALAKSQLPEPAHEEEAMPRFLASVGSERPQVSTALGVAEASEVLAGIESDAKRDRAQRLARDLAGDRSESRIAAARDLAGVAGALAAPLLAAAMRNAASDEERIALLEQIGRVGAHARGDAEGPLSVARRSIDAVLGDPDPFVRAAAFEAKLALAPREEAAAIAGAGLADPDPRVRRRLVLAVKAGVVGEIASLLLPVVSDPDPQARRAACAALAGERSPEVMKALARALDDEVDGVRAAAARSLKTMQWEMRHGAR
jgi:HEAT repeat protein